MDATFPPARQDPALAVSGLLTRLAIFSLVVLVPMLGMVSRRAVLVFIPLAAVLMVIAAGLRGTFPDTAGRFFRGLSYPAAAAALGLAIYAGISLTWSPPGSGGEVRLMQILAVAALFAFVIASLPRLARSPDVNLVPIGIAIAAVVLAIGFLPAFGNRSGTASPETLRSAVMLVLLTGPAVVALTAKRRFWQAAVLTLLIGMTLWLVGDALVLVGFVGMALALCAAQFWPSGTVLALGWGSIAALLLSPAAGWVMVNYGGRLLPGEGDALMAVWRDVTYALPTHPLLGFGFQASTVLQRGPTGVLLDNPRSAALQLWLELGLVGVALAVATLYLTMRAMLSASPELQRTLAPVMAGAGIFMVAGLSSWQIWWVIALGMALLLATFVGRIDRRRLRR